jgi:hypothetical protein
LDRGIATITSGIVPGFPANMPAHLEQAWLTLVSKPAAATITTTADNGVKIALKKQTKTAWALIAFLTGMGVVLLVGAWLFDRYQHSPGYDIPVRFRMLKLYGLAGMCVLIGLIMALVQALGGGESKDTVVTVVPGRLTVDRYLSGDHVVRTYSGGELRAIWVDSAIGLDVRLGPVNIGIFTPTDVQVATAEIIAAVFWGDEVTVSRDVPSPLAMGETVKVLSTRRQETVRP